MLKKLIGFIAMVAVVASMSTVVFAESDSIEYAEKKVDQANEKIESIIEKAQESEKYDVDKAVEKSNDTAEKAIVSSENKDVSVECELVEYQIDGEAVLIDPLKVIRF